MEEEEKTKIREEWKEKECEKISLEEREEERKRREVKKGTEREKEMKEVVERRKECISSLLDIGMKKNLEKIRNSIYFLVYPTVPSVK